MPLSLEDRYASHVENLRAVEIACEQIYRQLKACLASKQDAASDALRKTFTLLVGAWAEVRLLKLIHEPHGFSDADRADILGQRTKLEQWKRATELGFRRHYNVPNAALSLNSLPGTAALRYSEIHMLITSDMTPIIEIRNKLAHGQWARTFNNDMTDISGPMMALLNTENALSISFKRRILEALSRIIHDLVVSRPTFERDFDNNYKILNQAKSNLRTRSYEKWVLSQQEKLQRGRQKRAVTAKPADEIL